MLQQKPIDRLTTNFVRPLTSVDVVIFAIFEEELKVLLVKRNNEKCEPFPGYWALPGGFINVEQDISLEACAIRKLEEKTGVKENNGVSSNIPTFLFSLLLEIKKTPLSGTPDAVVFFFSR